MDVRSPILGAAAALLLTLGLTVALLPGPEPLEDDISPAGAPVEALARTSGVPAPAWRVGDAWVVRFEPSGFACMLVVAELGEAGPRQGASCEGAQFLAAEDAVFDYAFMGEFGPGLDGLRKDDPPVRFYDWPLVDGKRWETEWFGTDMEVTATYDAAIPGPRGPEAGFRLVMAHEGERLVSYDYLPSLAWWSRMAFASGFTMTVAPVEGPWHGEAVRAEATPRLELGYTFGLGPPTSTFVATEDDDMLLLRHVSEGMNLQQVRITDPDGVQVYQSTTTPLNPGAQSRMSYLAGVPGTWRVDAPRVGTGAVRILVDGVHLTTLAL